MYLVDIKMKKLLAIVCSKNFEDSAIQILKLINLAQLITARKLSVFVRFPSYSSAETKLKLNLYNSHANTPNKIETV